VGSFCWSRAAKTAGFYEYQEKEMRRRASTVGSQLGQRIRDLRKTLSFTQEELAKKAGIGVSYLSMIERAKRMPHFETLVRLAAALGITLSQLFIEAHEPTAEDLPLLAYLGTLRLDRSDVEVLLRVAKAMFDGKP
jgi:transcriptional regulator with XRE-family HTH domain